MTWKQTLRAAILTELRYADTLDYRELHRRIIPRLGGGIIWESDISAALKYLAKQGKIRYLTPAVGSHYVRVQIGE